MRAGLQKPINVNLGFILKTATLVCFISVALSTTSLAEERTLEERNKTLSNAAMEALTNRNFAKAAALFEQALANEPGDKQKIAIPYAQALVGGSVSMLDTNPKKAEFLLQRAIELDPENAEAFFYLGRLYSSKREYAKAIQAYDKTIGLDPYFTDGFFNLGFLYYSTKDYVKAEQMFARVVELRPSYLDEAYVNLAVVQNLQGKKKESIGNFERSLEINPRNTRAKKYLVRLTALSEINKSDKKVPRQTENSSEINESNKKVPKQKANIKGAEDGFKSTPLKLTVTYSDEDIQLIEKLIQKYGKDFIIETILEKRKGYITLFINSQYFEHSKPSTEISGWPDSKSITPLTILTDLRRIGISARFFEVQTEARFIAKEAEPAWRAIEQEARARAEEEEEAREKAIRSQANFCSNLFYSYQALSRREDSLMERYLDAKRNGSIYMWTEIDSILLEEIRQKKRALEAINRDKGCPARLF